MGTPKIFWYPDGSSSFRTINLPHVSAVHVSQFRDVVDAEGLTMTRLDRGGGRLVTIRGRYTTANHANTIRDLHTLDSHLRYGGRIAFCLDSDLAYLSVLVRSSLSGVNVVYTDSNLLPYTSGVVLQADTELTIQTTQPLRYERVKMSTGQVASGTGHKLTFSTNLFYTAPSGALIRPQYTFPVLYLDAAGANSGARWLDDSRFPGVIYELDLTLVELPHEVEAQAQGLLATANNQREAGGLTIEEQVQSSSFQDTRQATSETVQSSTFRVF